ncbi:hypothetical protein Ccrd_021538 [Cynara cardunculus var. scolymus]|uniref:Uncharacterized protein n=1 Tax=Cynara cardunculus var. scolymus TaxID=59895 RepID=A0A103Y0E6_CYNCS|nr:hypothetical protein Ccrd_021538 [Cynara cardunculus var. scolymus]
MVGGICVVDSHTSPCLGLDSLASSHVNHTSNGDLNLQRKSISKKLSSSFMDSKLPAKRIASKNQKRVKGFVIVNELGGQYDDSFHDVKAKLDHGEMYKNLSDQNLELMRERLMETVIWPSDDTNTEKIG